MWTCPNCGREFKRTNQGHYCGKSPETVEEYIDLQSPEARPHVTALSAILRGQEATERIAWSMPVYKKGRASISFAACKNHVSLYVDGHILEAFQPQLGGFTIKKNAVYLPYSKALPLEVLKDMVKQSFANSEEPAK